MALKLRPPQSVAAPTSLLLTCLASAFAPFASEPPTGSPIPPSSSPPNTLLDASAITNITAPSVSQNKPVAAQKTKPHQPLEAPSPATPLPTLDYPADLTVNSNLTFHETKQTRQLKEFQMQLELARRLRAAGELDTAKNNLTAVLDNNAPEEMKRGALLELASIAQEQNQFLRAQQIYAQYTQRFPTDASVPEVYLRQGLLYRQMGATTMALSKFYAVMTTALNLKLDQFDYYQKLVLHAQTEIAETYYLQGEYQQSVNFLSRLLILESPDLNKSQIQLKLIRSLAGLGRSPEIEAQARDFLNRFPEAPEQPEVRFLLSSALKQQGRNGDALQQVMRLLQMQQANATENPTEWLYWKQRTGNEIANQLFKEGDFVHALDVYLNLATLVDTVSWQFPVLYQIGLVYERLQQPPKAIEAYASIVNREQELSTNSTPSLKAILDMAKWRKDLLHWQNDASRLKAELTASELPKPQPLAAIP